MPIPALQNFTDRVGPLIASAWLNRVDAQSTTVFDGATTKSTVRTALTTDAPMEVTNGGTGVRSLTALMAALLPYLMVDLTQNVLGAILYPQTAAEAAGGSTIVNYAAPPGFQILGRYANDGAAYTQQGHDGAPVLSSTGGLSLYGSMGFGPRPEGQLLIANTLTSGHTIISLLNNVAGEESAIESLGVLSDGSIAQQGAQFWRFLNSVNTVGAWETVWANHLVGSGGTGDQVPIVCWSRNSVRLLAGLTVSAPWNSPPLANWCWISGSTMIDTALVVGAGHKYGVAANFIAEYNGNVQIGDVDGAGVTNHALQLGYISSAVTVQAFNNGSSAYIPLVLRSSQTIFDNGNVEPSGNGTLDLGSAIAAWNNIWAVNALHVTSDQTKKEDAGEFTEADRLLALRLKGKVRKFRWKAGEDKKIHIGHYAQEVIATAVECGVNIDELAFVEHSEEGYSIIQTELMLYIMALT